MKISILLLLSLFFYLNINAQEIVFKAHMNADNYFSWGSNSNPASYQPKALFGNYAIYTFDKSSYFSVYTVKDVDDKFKSILDSLTQYKANYNSNRKIDFDSTKIYLLDIQRNLKKSIDSIPQIVATTDVAKLLRASILQDLKETEISNLKDEISDLQNSIKSLKDEIEALKKKKPN